MPDNSEYIEYEIVISRTGQVKLEVLTEGLGAKCTQHSSQIEKLIGKVEKRDYKPEESQPIVNTQVQQQKQQQKQGL
jgi:hypothetical protein